MTEESTLELISLVKQYPVLYDRSHNLYKDSNAKTSAWKDIAKGCKLQVTDESECQSKWRALRDRYCKLKKKMMERENFKPSSSKIAEFIEQMSFMSNMIIHKPASKRKPNSEISKKRKLNIREKIIRSSKPIILGHKRKPRPITEQKIIVAAKQPQKEVVPVENGSPVVGASQEDKYVSIQSIQLLPSLPISQWPHLDDENVQYIKIQAEANGRNQSNWNDSPDEMVDYSIAITDCMGPNSMKGSPEPEPKMTGNSSELTQPLNDVQMEELCVPEVEVKTEKKETEKTDQFGVINTMWNIVKEKVQQECENSEDHLFAIHLTECLSKFPPRKRNLVKGEILMLMSKFDYKELN